jgi:hypothetical protein
VFQRFLLPADRRPAPNPEYTGTLYGLCRCMVENDGRHTSHLSAACNFHLADVYLT